MEGVLNDKVDLSNLDLHVLDESTACDRVSGGEKFDMIISISTDKPERDRLHQFFSACCEDVVALAFYDTCDFDSRNAPSTYHIGAIQEAAVRVRDRLADKLPTRVLIHCFAGWRRSPAAAQILLEVLGATPDESHAMVEKLRPRMWPNTLMLNLARGIVRPLAPAPMSARDPDERERGDQNFI
jgi:predicted protein tyrosine phosphatase